MKPKLRAHGHTEPHRSYEQVLVLMIWVLRVMFDFDEMVAGYCEVAAGG